nr:immunoglobulin light chain junction region [Macaca mulatta]
DYYCCSHRSGSTWKF